MISFFTSALGGTILGKVLDIGSRWFDTYAARQQAEIDILKAKALSELKIKEEELKAFTASQNSASEDAIGVPPQAAPWAANLAVIVDAFRRFTRPALTWGLAVVVTCLAFWGGLESAARATLVSEIVFCTATALTWWFGSRPRAASR